MYESNPLFPFLLPVCSGVLTDVLWYYITWCCAEIFFEHLVKVERLNEWSKVKRQMWSTPGFLRSAGLSATLDGELTDENNCKTPLFEYTPVKVNCRRDGILDW